MTLTKEELRPAIEKYAAQYGLRPAIVYGVIQQESGGNPFAVRHEPGYPYLFSPEKVKPGSCSHTTECIFQMTSLGLMQCMGAVYRELGFRGWIPEIFKSPELQIEYGCKHLSNKIKQWGSEEEGVSAFNCGIPDRDHNGRVDNPEYVRAVYGFAKQY